MNLNLITDTPPNDTDLLVILAHQFVNSDTTPCPNFFVYKVSDSVSV